jgi:hypothetical protein
MAGLCRLDCGSRIEGDRLSRPHDPRKTSKPFFVWFNLARMHIVTSPKYEAMLGEEGRQTGAYFPSAAATQGSSSKMLISPGLRHHTPLRGSRLALHGQSG